MADIPSGLEALAELIRLPPTDGAARQCCVEIPVGPLSAESLFEADTSSSACFWSESGSEPECEVGLGQALSFVAPLPSFAPFAPTARHALGRLDSEGTTRPARLYGGHAFDVPRSDREPAMPLPASVLFLPRLVYRHTGRDTTVTITLPREALDSCGGEGALRRRVEESFLTLSEAHPPAPRIPPIVRSVDQPDREGWSRMVEAGMSSILREDLRKVVLARSLHLCFAGPCPLAPVLTSLRLRATESTCFAFRERGVTFLGASPERLVRRRGRLVNLDALAGSAPVGAAHEASLLASEKDQREHAFVTEQLVQRLTSLGARLRELPEPALRRLEHLVHLHTPIHAELEDTACGILELVEHVHPTPAVGGIPREQALDFIRANEAVDRGWYAGPVGWCTSDGDGDFVVALRSGVFSGSDAVLFAGAGLVTGSAASAEWQETHLKFRTVLDALASGKRPIQGAS